MSKKSMVAVNPQISLTIGNPEIVNMLVQQQVRALKAELKELEKQSKDSYSTLRAGVVEIIASFNADFVAAYGKKLDAYTKARGALTGRSLRWLNPYPVEPGDNDIYREGGTCIRGFRGRGYGYAENDPWSEKEEKALSVAFEVNLLLSEIPSVKELNEWCNSWRTDFGSKAEAEEAWAQDSDEESGFSLSLKRSEKTIELIKKYRALDNEGIPIRKRIDELNNLLKDTANIEKAVLAQMTQNTLESNPELVDAFGVLTKGILGLPYLETKQLTVKTE